MRAYEVNFDGIVGQTHQYSGLSYGNLPSTQNQYLPANPKEAALQGLKKMKLLADLGVKQAVLPPQERPHLPTLRRIGFTGSDAQLVAAAYAVSPELLYTLSSASCMWTANAATTTPSTDSSDGKVHFTPANLSSNLHRSIETATTEKILKKIFSDPGHFVHHSSLPSGAYFSDEGAANQCRLCHTQGEPGLQLFVYGRRCSGPHPKPQKYPARQTFEASSALARLHRLDPQRTLYVQQHPEAIDAGVFHNDLAAASHETLLLFHARAYLEKEKFLAELLEKARQLHDCQLRCIEVKEEEIPLKEAVDTFFFNAQLVTDAKGTTHLLSPLECRENSKTKTFIEHLKKERFFQEVHYIDLKQSMRNGGGPACLRLRVVLTEKECAAAHPFVFLTPTLYEQLVHWVEKHYRDRLLPQDLADPQLLHEVQHALDALTQILQLGPLYDFQQQGREKKFNTKQEK
jgi:succinylarginine dihydrolase